MQERLNIIEEIINTTLESMQRDIKELYLLQAKLRKIKLEAQCVMGTEDEHSRLQTMYNTLTADMPRIINDWNIPSNQDN